MWFQKSKEYIDFIIREQKCFLEHSIWTLVEEYGHIYEEDEKNEIKRTKLNVDPS